MTETSTQAELSSTGKTWGLSSLQGVVRRLDLRPWEAASYAILLLIGLSMRLWDLGSRAMHHDESLHALYSWNLFTGDGFRHNPMMHGPFQFEANAALFFVFGDSDVTARLLYAVMGTVLILMPLLLRWRLGRLGALFSAALLTASPTILYFSRFARNDILMAVWALGLVICMWRYFDEGRSRYLYVAAALLALAFGTKESSYLVVATLGLWSFMLAVHPYVSRALQFVDFQGVSPPAALGRVLKALLDQLPGEGIDLRALSRPAAFMVFLITITLPQWSAFAAILQDSTLFGWTNLVLAAPVGSLNIGAPVGGANVIAFLIVVGTLGASIYFGFRWNWSVWWKSALIFYTIWTLLYTTFLTNFYGGIKSGIWQALGYWVVQQGEGRGAQPWYYYFIITSVYEFLPFLIGIIAAVYFLLRRRDSFTMFLVFWPLTTFLLYTVASEKMPWLLVNITLPFILLSAKLLADVVERIDWGRLFDNGGYFLIPGIPLFIIMLWNLAMYTAPESDALGVLFPVLIAVVLIAMAGAGVYLYRQVGRRNLLSVSLLGLTAVMLVLTVRAGVIASYRNGDTPIELIVYTQTSPDVLRVLDKVEEAVASRKVVAIDGTSGFSWPWAWYLRDQQGIDYAPHIAASFNVTPSDEVIIVHSNSHIAAENNLSGMYSQGERIRHRWWFPEHLYRDLKPMTVIKAVFDRSSWRSAARYWLHREGIKERIGSEDSYAYFRLGASQDAR